MGGVELINDGLVLPVLAAPFVGSFSGLLIARLPAGVGVVWGRSACASCGHALGVPDLVPLASFLALRGRCRHCRAAIPRRDFAVELCAVCIALLAIGAGETGWQLWAGCALGWTLLTLGWIDAVSMRLPDMLTLPLILAGLAEAAWLEPEALTDRALGAAIGYTLLWSLAWAYRRVRGREGVGLGDAKLLAAGGAWVGVALLPPVLLGAALAGLAWAFRRGAADLSGRMPFGPFLAGSIFAVWLFA